MIQANQAKNMYFEDNGKSLTINLHFIILKVYFYAHIVQFKKSLCGILFFFSKRLFSAFLTNRLWKRLRD